MNGTVNPSVQSNGDALKDLGTVAAVTGGAGALAASIIHYLKDRRDATKRKKLLDSAVQSDMPIVRINNRVKDTETDMNLDQAGLNVDEQVSKVSALNTGPHINPETLSQVRGEGKPDSSVIVSGALAPAAATASAAGSAMNTFVTSSPTIDRMVSYLASPDKPLWAGPATIAASLATAYGGYKGMEWLIDKINNDDAEFDINRKRNLLNSKVHKLLSEKYGDAQKVASICCEAGRISGIPFNGFSLSLAEREALNEEAEKEAALEKQACLMEKQAEFDPQALAASKERTDAMSAKLSPSGQGIRDFTALYLLAATGLTGVTYALSKKYFDRRSERRRRLKEIEAEIRRKALSKEAPMLIDADFDLPHEKALNPGVNTEVAAVKGTLAPAAVKPAAAIESSAQGVVTPAPHDNLLSAGTDAVPLTTPLKDKSILD